MSNVEELSAKLSRLDGKARARPLVELAQALSDEYWRSGPGKPESLPLLDRAIVAVDEAYGYFDAADGMRRHVAGLRGWLHGSRRLGHFGPPEDLRIGLDQLEDALLAPNLPPMMAANCQLTLGQLLMAGVTPILQSPDIFAKIMSGGIPASAAVDLERAIACFEQVRTAPGMAREMLQTAQTLLRMAGAMRTMVTIPGGGSGVETMNRIMEVAAAFQEIHKEQSAIAASGPMGGADSIYHAEFIADQPPVDRPVPLIEVEDRDATPDGVKPFQPAHRDADDPAALRRELRARVSAGRDLFEALEAVLDPAAPAPPIDLVDDVVALATAIVDAGAANRTDHLLLAVGLCLRAGAAGTRRVREDLDEATDSLLGAAASARTAPPETVRVMRRLAAMLDAAEPRRRAAARLSDVLGRTAARA